MEKTKIEFFDSRLIREATVAHARLSMTWKRRTRGFSMGKSLERTGTVIDPDRVEELEIMERLDHLKKNFDELDFAGQFLHLWMSGIIKLMRRPETWQKIESSIRERFPGFLDVVRSWRPETTRVMKRAVPWMKVGYSIRERFLALLNIVRHWRLDKSAETTCFLGYMKPLLE